MPSQLFFYWRQTADESAAWFPGSVMLEPNETVGMLQERLALRLGSTVAEAFKHPPQLLRLDSKGVPTPDVMDVPHALLLMADVHTVQSKYMYDGGQHGGLPAAALAFVFPPGAPSTRPASNEVHMTV